MARHQFDDRIGYRRFKVEYPKLRSVDVTEALFGRLGLDSSTTIVPADAALPGRVYPLKVWTLEFTIFPRVPQLPASFR